MIQVKPIFTIGHSTQPLEEFLAHLTNHSIDVIADVRSSPFSQKFPQFSRTNLKPVLEAIGIKYVFLGREFGARRDEPECYVGDMADYELISGLPLFQEGLKRLAKGTHDHRIALMCAEHDPLTCHRTILVCRHLKCINSDIFHILRNSAVETHEEAERRLAIEEGQNIAQSSMFNNTSKDDALTRAYTTRGQRIAYRRESETDEDTHNRFY